MLPAPDPKRDEGTPEERAQEERRRQLVELLAEIEKRINDENARPKKRYISPATREEVYAMYYDQLRRKIEERGTRNFPEYQGKKMYGELTMNVTVDAEGRVLDTEVIQSSNNKLLDRRAVAIVKAASPFGPFSSRDAPQGRPAGDHLALQVHPRRWTGNHAQHHPLRCCSANQDADDIHRHPSTSTPWSATRSRTASRPSSMRPSRRPTGQTLSYGRLLVPLDDFAGALRRWVAAAEGGPVRGCNVTVPFKFEAFGLGARRTPRAELAGAANVLSFETDGWLADNTDGVGLVADIERNAGVPLAGRRVLLIGAGGAAAGTVGALLAAGPAQLTVTNRTLDKARALVARLAPYGRQGTRLVAAPLVDCGEAFDVVINGTSSSLQGADIPVAAGRCWHRVRWRST